MMGDKIHFQCGYFQLRCRLAVNGQVLQVLELTSFRSVFDSVDPLVLLEIKSIASDNVFISVLNKLDLGLKDKGALFDVSLSAKTGEGVVELKKKISSASAVRGLVDKEYFARNRHIKLFNEGLGHLEAAMAKLRSGFDVELAAEDLRLARISLDEVVGVKTSDSLLGDIFNDFCIGK